MKATLLTGIREMVSREIPDPEIQRDTDVLIRMVRIGVCGSDVHYYTTGRIGSQVVEYPFVVGHECAGVVEKIGAGVTRVREGDRVAVDPAISCPPVGALCDQCLADRPHTCRNLLFLGCPGQIAGCLSEYIVMPEASCYAIGEDMTLDQAALSEPLSIGVYGVAQSAGMGGASIAVLGVGPIGLSVLLPARAQGAEEIYVTDKIDTRLAVARSAGADWAGNPDTQDVVGEILAAQPAGMDVVFECCGQQDALDQAVDLLKPGGKLMLIGIPQVDRVSFVIDELRRKEICVQNVRRQKHCVQPALDMIADGSVHVDFMVTHRFPLAECKEAFDLVAEYGDGVIKAMIELPR